MVTSASPDVKKKKLLLSQSMRASSMNASTMIDEIKDLEEDFVPTAYLGLVVGITDYSKFRQRDDCEAYNDMKGSEDVETVKRMLIKLGVPEKDIDILVEPQLDEIKSAVNRTI